MALSPVIFIVMAVAVRIALTLFPGHVITIGVVLDAGMDKEAVSDAVTQATGTFFDVHPFTPIPTFKWVTLNSTRSGMVQSVIEMLQENVTALISVLSCLDTRIVSAVTQTFQTPHLSLDLDPCPSRTTEEFTLHLIPENNNVAAVLVDLVQAAKRKFLYLKFGKRVDNRVRQQWLVELSSAGVHTVLIDSVNNTPLWRSSGNDTLVTAAIPLQEAEINGLKAADLILVLFPLDTAEKSKASHIKECGYSSCVLAESRLTPSCVKSSLPLMTSSKKLTVSESRLIRAALMMYLAFNNLLNLYTDQKVSNWSVNEPRMPLKHLGVLEAFRQVCSVTKPCSCEGGTTEYSLYSVPVGLGTELTPIGNWTVSKGLTVNRTLPEVNKLFKNRLTDFGGVNLRIAVDPVSHPYVNRSECGNNSYHGLMVDILEDLGKKLNFRYTFVVAPDGFYGAKREDGTWSGMVGLVARGEADLGAAPFTVTKERSEAVDFTTPFQQESLGILTAAPRETASQFQFLKPFSFDVWLSVMASLLIASLGLVCIGLKSPLQKQHDPNNPHLKLERSVQENIFLIISSYFEQGPTFHPTSVSARCFLSFWFVFTILIMAMYTAHLAAVLTVSTPIRPINSLQDLADRSDMAVFTLAESNTYTVLAQSERPLYKIIAGRLKTMPSMTKLLRGVNEGKYAILGDRAFLNYRAAISCGATRTAEERFYGFSLAFIITKNSPYNDAISINIQKMVESGLFQKLEAKWLKPVQYCRPEEVKVHQLELDTLGGVFIVYGSITLTAVFACLLKIYLIRCKRCVTLSCEKPG